MMKHSQLPYRHEGGISSLSVSDDSATLCVTSLDESATLWDLNGLTEIAKLPHKESVNSSIFANDNTLLTGCEDGTVCVWDNRKLAEPNYVLKGFKEGVNKMIFNAERSILYSACDDGMVYVHQMTHDMPLLDRLFVSSNTVNDLIYVAETDTLITSDENSNVTLLKLGNWREMETDDRILTTIDAFQDPVNHIALFNNTLYAATTNFIFDFQFDPNQGFAEEAQVFEGHEDYIRGIEFLDNDTMVTVGDDKSIIEWSLSTHGPTNQFVAHDDLIMCSAVRRDSEEGKPQVLITGCEDGTVRLWNLPFTKD